MFEMSFFIMVYEDALPLGLQVIELAPMQRPGKHSQNQQHQCGRKRNEQVHAFHSTILCVQSAARSALSTTNSELVAMPSPAAQGGNHPAKARGMATML